MQDATAQMALLQFMTAGLAEVAVPTTVHCDHLIQAKDGAGIDLKSRSTTNNEVYDFLRTVSAKYGIGFWKPGSGIIHQVVLENYAFPGGMMIGTDSHTPNAGGLGMVAIGVGGADAVDVMTGFPFNVRWPKLIGVHLTGELSGWSRAEGRHPQGRRDPHRRRAAPAPSSSTSVRAPTRSPPPARPRSATWAPRSARPRRSSPTTTNMAAYLKATGREAIADAANAVAADLRPDAEVEADPGTYFDQVIEIDLSTLEPLINGPHTPDLAHQVSEVGARRQGRTAGRCEISSALVGSCTNSSYEDITRAASIARQASAKGLRAKTQLLDHARAPSRCGRPSSATACWPTSRPSAATVLANACGPCIGQWDRTDVDPWRSQHDRQQLQPQLPEAQRRQRATRSPS